LNWPDVGVSGHRKPHSGPHHELHIGSYEWIAREMNSHTEGHMGSPHIRSQERIAWTHPKVNCLAIFGGFPSFSSLLRVANSSRRNSSSFKLTCQKRVLTPRVFEQQLWRYCSISMYSGLFYLDSFWMKNMGYTASTVRRFVHVFTDLFVCRHVGCALDRSLYSLRLWMSIILSFVLSKNKFKFK
jgi:hypothetical protein